MNEIGKTISDQAKNKNISLCLYVICKKGEAVLYNI